jgi:hypothetical protein
MALSARSYDLVPVVAMSKMYTTSIIATVTSLIAICFRRQAHSLSSKDKDWGRVAELSLNLALNDVNKGNKWIFTDWNKLDINLTQCIGSHRVG